MYCYEWNYPEKMIAFTQSMGIYDCLDPLKYRVDFVSCVIPYNDIKALYGLNAFFYRGGVKVREGRQADMEIKKDPSFDSVEFSGSVEAPETGWYLIYAEKAKIHSLEANGDPEKSNGCVYLLRGINRIKFGLKDFSGDAKVLWLAQGGTAEKIPAANIMAKEYTPALKNYIMKKGKKLYESFDYAVSNRLYWGGARVPADITAKEGDFTRVWDSSLKVERAGYYSYSVNTPSDCRIYIDNALVYDKKAQKESSKELYLAKGRHKISVRQIYGYIPYVGNLYHIQLLVKKKGDKLPREVLYSEFSPG
jgi:hypothetical protein